MNLEQQHKAAGLRRFRAWYRLTNALLARQQGTHVPTELVEELALEHRAASDAEHALWQQMLGLRRAS